LLGREPRATEAGGLNLNSPAPLPGDLADVLGVVERLGLILDIRGAPLSEGISAAGA